MCCFDCTGYKEKHFTGVALALSLIYSIKLEWLTAVVLQTDLRSLSLILLKILCEDRGVCVCHIDDTGGVTGLFHCALVFLILGFTRARAVCLCLCCPVLLSMRV